MAPMLQHVEDDIDGNLHICWSGSARQSLRLLVNNAVERVVQPAAGCLCIYESIDLGKLLCFFHWFVQIIWIHGKSRLYAYHLELSTSEVVGHWAPVAPGPKTAEELSTYTPLVCYNKHCRAHPAARVSNLPSLSAAPIKESMRSLQYY
jgi:hypothetical protein